MDGGSALFQNSGDGGVRDKKFACDGEKKKKKTLFRRSAFARRQPSEGELVVITVGVTLP